MESGRPPNHKPKLTITEQIEDLRRRGVRFSESETAFARTCLTSHRSLLHLSAYRELFPKHLEGPNKGKYIDLSFTDLIALDELDGQLRKVFLDVTLEVENAARMRILSTVSEMPEEDGYETIQDFFAKLPPKYRASIRAELERRCDPDRPSFDIYRGSLTKKYLDDMPVWVFVEVISFGALLSLYRFCAKRWGDREMLNAYYTLKQVKDVRNACAHQSCIINGFNRFERTPRRPSKEVYQALDRAGLRNSPAQKEKLGNPRIQQLICTLYAYDRFVQPRTDALKGKVANLSRKLKRASINYSTARGMDTFIYFDYLAAVIDRLVYVSV